MLGVGLEFAPFAGLIPPIAQVFLMGIREVVITPLRRKDYLSFLRSQNGHLIILADSYEHYLSYRPRVTGTVKVTTAERASRTKDVGDEASFIGSTKAGSDILEHKEMPPPYRWIC